MKISEYWSDVNTWRCTDYKTGCTVLDFLKFTDQGLGKISQVRVAIVNGWKYQRNNKSFGGTVSEVVANSANTSELREIIFCR